VAGAKCEKAWAGRSVAVSRRLQLFAKSELIKTSINKQTLICWITELFLAQFVAVYIEFERIRRALSTYPIWLAKWQFF
jgi:hypothetical protein